MTNFSDLFSVTNRELLKTALITAISAAFGVIYLKFKEKQRFTKEDFISAGMVGLSAGISYFSTKFFSGKPEVVAIDPTKTAVINEKTDKIISHPDTHEETQIK